MICPRCKTRLETEDPLYCTVCGKQLRRDDAFDGEFEEEFRFDEEIAEAEKQDETLRALLRAERRRTILKILLASLFVTLLIALTVFLVLPAFQPNTTQESPSADPLPADDTLSKEEQKDIAAKAEALLLAGNQSYDLNALLEFVPQEARDACLKELCQSYGCEDRAALEERFLTLRKEQSYRFEELRTSVTLMDESATESLKDDLLRRFGIEKARIGKAVHAEITCRATRAEDTASYVAVYSFAEIDGVYYSTDF